MNNEPIHVSATCDTNFVYILRCYKSLKINKQIQLIVLLLISMVLGSWLFSLQSQFVWPLWYIWLCNKKISLVRCKRVSIRFAWKVSQSRLIDQQMLIRIRIENISTQAFYQHSCQADICRNSTCEFYKTCLETNLVSSSLVLLVTRTPVSTRINCINTYQPVSTSQLMQVPACSSASCFLLPVLLQAYLINNHTRKFQTEKVSINLTISLLKKKDDSDSTNNCDYSYFNIRLCSLRNKTRVKIIEYSPVTGIEYTAKLFCYIDPQVAQTLTWIGVIQ